MDVIGNGRNTCALTPMAIQAEGGKALARPPGEGPHRRRVHQGAHQVDRRREDPATPAKRGEIVVIAASRAPDDAGNITTLGRGGSTPPAVAVAAAIKARRLRDLPTSTAYTTDPNICASAKKIRSNLHEEMLEARIALCEGAADPQRGDCDEYGVPVHVRSSFSDAQARG